MGMIAAWTDERIARLKELQATKISNSAIAAAMSEPGFEVSKNSVIGKLHRLGISAARPPRAACGVLTAIRVKRRLLARGPTGAMRPVPLPPRAEPIEDIPSPGVSLWEARTGQCRWPLNDVAPVSDFLFCGAPVAGEKCSWCVRHRKVAMLPVRAAVYVPVIEN